MSKKALSSPISLLRANSATTAHGTEEVRVDALPFEEVVSLKVEARPRGRPLDVITPENSLSAVARLYRRQFSRPYGYSVTPNSLGFRRCRTRPSQYPGQTWRLLRRSRPGRTAYRFGLFGCQKLSPPQTTEQRGCSRSLRDKATSEREGSAYKGRWRWLRRYLKRKSSE